MGLPDGWVISARPAHPALVSEEDFVAVQGIRPPRDNGTAASRRYLLAGLLRCGICGRAAGVLLGEQPARLPVPSRHTSATQPDPGRPKNLYIRYIREDRIVPRLPALPALLIATEPAAGRRRRRTRRGMDISRLVSGTCGHRTGDESTLAASAKRS